MTLLLAFPGMAELGAAIAEALGGEFRALDIHRFPDGESLVTLPEVSGRDVAILATLHHPDALALPLWFAAHEARAMGAGSVGLIAPYLAYMRQDRAFAPGQAVSAPLFARFLEQGFDWLVTADPHLHRIRTLGEIFRIPAERVEAAPLLAQWIEQNIEHPIVIGPDSESKQWVAEVARLAGAPFQVLAKQRHGDRSVEISGLDGDDLGSRTPVILDDIASTGQTMIKTVEKLLALGSRPPVCVVIHAVFAGNAYRDILAAGAARIVSTDSIPHASNAITLAHGLAAAVVGVSQQAPPAVSLHKT